GRLRNARPLRAGAGCATDRATRESGRAPTSRSRPASVGSRVLAAPLGVGRAQVDAHLPVVVLVVEVVARCDAPDVADAEVAVARQWRGCREDGLAVELDLRL